jgi:hypothetical protein
MDNDTAVCPFYEMRGITTTTMMTIWTVRTTARFNQRRVV